MKMQNECAGLPGWRMCVTKNRGRMGFRDLHAFNLAMLAKQVWRLIINPNSLCAKILNAKYYPNSGILMAGPKSFLLELKLSDVSTFGALATGPL